MTGPSCFTFLSSKIELSDAAAWNAPQLEKLHLYNLHYFDDLNASSAIERSDWHRALIDRWVAENPPVGGAGWEPYPLSLRVVNWIKWSLSKNALSHSAIHSLAIQVRYLTTRLERHLLGNHLFANAKALVFAGCYFEGDEAAEWLRCGMRILEGEISEQILADGGHFERSTMYHALALEDMLDLLNLSRMFPDVFHEWRELVDRLPAVVEQMKKWLAAMCHPDGEISFFNDAAIGIAPPPEELFLYSNRLGCTCETATVDGVTWLKESGYIRVQDGDTVAILDVAPVGPDYLPGHAHADTLSFELSVGKRRVIVNSGTSRYGLGPQREHQRSTAAHSTVAINGENSSEVWAGFRVARRAYPFDVTVEETDEGICVSGSHDGYRRLPGRPVHRRQWTIRDGFIEVSDRIEGDFSEAVARYFLHPDVQVERGVGKSSARLGDIGLAWKAEGALMQVVESEYFPEFGIVCPSSCIELKASNSQFGFHLDWGVRCPETGLRQ